MRPGSPSSPSARRGRHLGCLCPSGRSIFRPSMPANDNVMEKLVSLAKRRGFVFQSSEIYGGLGAGWGYGPLRVGVKKKIKGRLGGSLVAARGDNAGLGPG